jgi:hypothetical protein
MPAPRARALAATPLCGRAEFEERRGSRASRHGGGSAGCRREKLKSWNPGNLQARGEGQVSRFPPRRPLNRRASHPRLAYTARDMGAAE